jgi:hypothetical protein
MAASKYDFTIEQGTSFKFSLIYKDSNNVPIDLTGWCARLSLKSNKNTTHIFSTLNLDYSTYKFSIDEPNGKITLLIPANTTNMFNFNIANYDLELQSPDDLYDGGGKYTVRLLYGQINVVPRYSENSTVLDCSNG